MRSLTSAGDRLAALLILVIIGAALSLVSCAPCSASRYSPSVVTADYFRVIDLATCPRVSPWAVRSAYTFHGVTYPADSSRLSSATVTLDGCGR